MTETKKTLDYKLDESYKTAELFTRETETATPTRIVIAQTCEDDRERIRSMAPESPHEISVVGKPSEALELIRKDYVAVFITGLAFYTTDETGKRHSIGEHVDDYMRLVRKESPDTLILSYSLIAGITQKPAHGDIPKTYSGEHLKRFIAHPDLGTLVKSKDRDCLQREFPDITFYED